ncbi:uncharacterized protein htt [Eurosta solidaginis]|uniref:uncharacterized protein htt n=1 Tax=Eurosta solidaginis TaxID=178769 RepID=UPI003530FD2B
MDKSMVNQFTSIVEQLRNTECNQKEKIACFQHIAECIMSPALAGHINYATHINMATTVLLLFCEDLDPVVRMNAEENLNRIFRALEKTRVSRVLMDLYGEIKRNGNYRSLRICLNLFAYYAPQIRERNIKWYAVRLSPCLQIIALRKETQLCETLCDFVKNFGTHLQMGLTDSESCKLFEAFMANIGVECAVKRRCSAQNCISLIENSRNKSLMAKHGLNKTFEFLLNDQQQHNVLGVLGLLRLLLPLIIHGFYADCTDDYEDDHSTPKHTGINKSKANNSKNQGSLTHSTTTFTASTSKKSTPTSTPINSKECRQIIEIFDYCLHLLNISNASQHSIINAALEVINAILLALDIANCNNNNHSNGKNNSDLIKSLQAGLCNQQLQHAEYLRRRKSLKNQIFQLRNYEVSAAVPSGVNIGTVGVDSVMLEGGQEVASSTWQKGSGTEENCVGLSGIDVDSEGEVVLRRAPNIRYAGRSVSECLVDEDDDDGAHRTALSTDLVAVAHTDVNPIGRNVYADSVVVGSVLDDVDDDGDFTTLSEINEPQQLRASTAIAMVPPSYALTTTIDADNLIDAIDATAPTSTTETVNAASNNSSRVVHTKTQGMQSQNPDSQQIEQQRQMLERQVKPQNLLTATNKRIDAALGAGVGGGGGSSGSGSSGSSDDKSQHLSDIDNESFNSIDFEAEITIAGMSGANADDRSLKARKVEDSNNEIDAVDNVAAGNSKLSSSNSDTIGSFFNNLISNAASESMSKLFRPSTGARATPTKSVPPTTTSEKLFDETASNMSAATSMAVVDNISLISTASSNNKILDLSTSAGLDSTQSDSVHTNTQSYASSSVGMHDDTASTALLVDTSLHSVTGDETDGGGYGQSEKIAVERRVPNANPFLSEKSPLKNSAPGIPLLNLQIGTLFEQSIVRYTARLIAARFLLTGQAGALHDDTQIRISIKSLSLSVLAHCVRFDPEVLQLPLEITERELLETRKQSPVRNVAAAAQSPSKSSNASGSPSIPQTDVSRSGSSSNLGKDYEHVDAVDFIKNKFSSTTTRNAELPAELQLLEIKDDHFGKSNFDYLFNTTMDKLSKSADPVLISQQIRGVSAISDSKQRQHGAPALLSKSEIIESKTQQQQKEKTQQQQKEKKPIHPLASPPLVTESMQDTPPEILPPRPPKRTKSQRKSISAATATVAALVQIDENICGRPLLTTPASNLPYLQQLTDVLLYYNHTDPMLRGGVQQIISSFLRAVSAREVNLRLELNVQHLLAMLVKGLQDEIHTVVIQALNAFEKIFPYVVSKYLILSTAHHQRKQQHQQQHQKQEGKTDAGRLESLAGDCVEAADKSNRKYHANATSQVTQQRQQQHSTNDIPNSWFNTHVSCKTPTAMGSKSVNAETCTRKLFNDNDELIAALLNDFQLQSKSKQISNNNSNNTIDSTQSQSLRAGCPTISSTTTSSPDLLPFSEFYISPKLLLSKLRLCHYNKYWLVQNKYAEVISNLNYAALHAACNDCHGYCCGTTIGCECDIGVAEEYGNADSANSKLNIDKNTVKENPSTTWKCEEMSYDDLSDNVCIYESQFLDELLHLIGDDDFRVREHAAQCLCRFIIKNAKYKQQNKKQQQYVNNNDTFMYAPTPTPTTTPATNKFSNQYPATVGLFGGIDVGVTTGDDKSLPSATYETNFNLLWDFFDYRLFSGLPLPLRNLFRGLSPPPHTATNTATTNTTTMPNIDTFDDLADALPQRYRAEEEKLLSKVLYRMTNKLMELDDKNAQFGIIYALKLLLQDFNFIDYQRAWIEFNFIEICQRFSYHNYVTAIDLACQNDLIDVTGNLMAGYILASTLTADQPERMLQQQLDQLLVHVMKILNIYYHIVTQQKPLLFAKVQKSDLFPNAKELALVQSVGYFGSEYVYIKLYNILRSANNSYKITINQESGKLLISLLRTCLNTLSLCIELRTHTTPLSAGTPIHTSSQRINSPSSSGGGAIGFSRTNSGRDTSPTVGTAFGVIGGGGSGTSAVYPSNATLKLIEEILQYLSTLVNYAPGECIVCLRQLLKYLFGQNYGNQQRDYYATFIRPYFAVRSKTEQQLQLHHQQQQQNLQQQSQRYIQAQQDGDNSRNTHIGGSADHPYILNYSMSTTTPTKPTKLLAFSTATGIVRSAATIGSLTTALQQGSTAVGGVDSLSTPTMSMSSNVKHNELNVIGKQAATYISHSQANLNVTEYYRLMGELFVGGLNLETWKSERASECVKHIKLFEPLVIYCLMLFLKSNARIQAPILELLHQLLELNVTYSVLDSKNVIFDQILNNLDLIENGIVRNGPLIIPPMIKFLIQLTNKSDRKLITIPKIISITNNLLANNAVLDCAVIALKSLAYEIFFLPHMGGSTTALTTFGDYRAPFQSPVTRSPVQQRRHAVEDTATATAAAEALLANSRELDTQKEVVLGMLEKFIDANDLHGVVALLLLRERSAQHLEGGRFGRQTDARSEDALERKRGCCTLESTLLQDPSAVYALICRAMCDGHLNVRSWREFYLLESCFKNYSKYVLADSKNFLALLQLFLTENVENFSALAYATIILANVILKTEEIYLVNHIKLYLKNHPAVEERERHRNQLQQQQRTTTTHWLLEGPSTSTAAAALASSTSGPVSTSASASSGSISEINYFAKVLCEKLENCLDVIISSTATPTKVTTTTTAASSGYGNVAYCQLVCRFVDALHVVCCRSKHKDALQSVFRLVLAESSLLDKYCNFVTSSGGEEDGFLFGGDGAVVPSTLAMQLQLEVLKLLSAMKLLDPVVMLQLLEQQKQKARVPQQQQQYELQMTTNKERVKWYASMQRTLLSEIFQEKPNARDWTVQQVKQLLNAGGATVVNFLITCNFEFVSDLCEVAAIAATAAVAKDHDAPAQGSVGGELGSLWLNALLQHANSLNKRSIRALPPLLLRLCKATTAKGATSPKGCYLEFSLLSLQLLRRLYTRCKYSRAILVRLERLVRRLVFQCSIETVAAPLEKQQLLRQLEEFVGDQLPQEVPQGRSSSQFWQQLLLDTQECKVAAQPLAEQQHQQPQQQQQKNMIDEKWLLSQLIKFSAQPDYGAQQLSRILLEIQSEQKLYRIFNCSEFAVARVLRHAIASSMQAMLVAFRQNCIQHNPHIHYMQPNPLVRVTCAVLMTSISAQIAKDNSEHARTKTTTITTAAMSSVSTEEPAIESQKCIKTESGFYLCDAVTTLMGYVRKVEENALLYIESRFIDKFVREQLLRPESVATLLEFLDWCCWQVQQQFMMHQKQLDHSRQQHIHSLLQCIAAMLQQRCIWVELNQMEKSTATATTQVTARITQTMQTCTSSLLTLQQRNLLLCRVLDVLVLTARHTLQHTIFYRYYKQQAVDVVFRGAGKVDVAAETFDNNETQNIFNTVNTAASATELEGALLITDNETDIAIGWLLQAYAPQAVFIGKLIEMHGSVNPSAAYITGTTAKGGTLSGAGCTMSAGGGGGGASSSMSMTQGGGAGTVGGGAACDAYSDFKTGSNAEISMDILVAIGIAVLRMNQFYAYAVTPFEIIQQQQREQQRVEQLSPVKQTGQFTTPKATTSAAVTAAASCGKLPTIPVESLSDVDILRKFVKRLSILGFTTRQQFEEYFMTFLLLINKVYDENMVDEQEQFQIRSTCLEAILELLITYKTFPIVGNKLSYFHHTTRWTRINCDSISLKKLHKVQLLVSEANVFYHPNLERQLRSNNTGSSPHFNIVSNASCLRDTVIGTSQFRVNQYDLNFMWQQMEAYADNTANSNNNSENDAEMSPSSGGGDATHRKARSLVSGMACNNEDTATKNYRYFTTQSGVDFKSSTQLIFDVLMQIIENNHILVLPNLVKFTEICESRDQIKWIKDKALKLQETIAMDDTISHQHLIYLLCKTQAMLIPTIGELQQLCQLIGNYLKSSHIFIRNATLAGLLCLLECCSKTNTTIGKLSEELALLRELIVGYINRHGIIDVSSMQCSDTHTKLVWTLNYCLIEWTSKFVPQCPLLSNTVIAAGNFLRKTNNEDVYLCVLHGLERMIVISNTGNGNATGLTGASSAAASGVGIITPILRNKIEKLALELVKLENERFSIPALQLLLSCIYVGSSKQLENTELSNGIVQDEPEIIAQQTDKVDILLHCIKSSTRDAAWIYGQVLCQIIRDLVPPNEILTKVIKEFLAINQPHCDVIAMIVYQVFRCAIDSTFLQMLQDWLVCSLPTFLALPERKGVWCLSVIFLSASINLHLIKLFPLLLSTAAVAAASSSTDNAAGSGDNSSSGNESMAVNVGSDAGDREFHKLGQHEIALFVTAAADFHAKLSGEQRMRFRDAFEKFQRQPVYAKLLQNL